LNHASGKDLELAGVAPAKIYVTYGYSSLEEYSDFNAYTDIREEFNIPYDNKIILAMHRMVAKKGYETFIDMIPYITKDYDKVTFLLVGDGPLRSEFEKRVNDLNVQEYVRFVGFRTDIINIFKQIDFGVYPLADTAAMGGVIRAGKILITKKDSSMDEHIIDGLTGYLVPNDTAEAYASYALKLLKDDKLLKRMESEQLRFIQDRFDGKKNIRKLEELFVHLYNQNNVNEKKE
jgi:glycosyltransferase involved in cell wall biosynthesis